MPTKKTIKKKTDSRLLVVKTEEVPLRELNVYHKNPNVGNVDLIAKSLHINGLFRPIVVNIGTHTGRPNEILAGNHTYLAARKPLFWQHKGQNGEPPTTQDKPAWDTILCSFVDVDDTKAAQIVAVDNKAAKAGRIDDEALYEMFKGLPDMNLDAAGYNDKEWEELSDKFSVDDMPDLSEAALGLGDADDDDDDNPSVAPPKFDDTEFGDEGEATDDAPSVASRAATKDEEEDPDDPDAAGIEITQVDEEIRGAFDLKDDMYFDGQGYYNIPKLRKDMLVQVDEVPETLTTWAGSATKYDDDPDTYWLYNFGVDSTSGMKDISKVIVSFYTFDEYFEPWWFGPAKYTGKMLNSGIKMALTPDFSDDTNAGRAFCLYQLYRSRWLGRYFQEAGLKLIPSLHWPDGDLDYLRDITLPTLPKNVPVISLQLQTYTDKLDDEHKDRLAAEYQLIMDTVKPKMVLLYAGQPGYEFFTSRVKTGDSQIKFLLNRQAKLSVSRQGRGKKNTL